MLKKIVAVVTGVVSAGLVISMAERVGHAIYPPPAGLDVSDPAAIEALIKSLPVGAFLLVLFAWLAGIVVGATVACLIVRENARLYTAIIGGLVLAGTIVSFVMIPHPAWFAAVSVAVIIGITALTAWILGNTVAKSP